MPDLTQMYQLFSRVKGGQQVLLQHWSDYIKVRGAVSAGRGCAVAVAVPHVGRTLHLQGVWRLAEELGGLQAPWFSWVDRSPTLPSRLLAQTFVCKDDASSAGTAYSQL